VSSQAERGRGASCGGSLWSAVQVGADQIRERLDVDGVAVTMQEAHTGGIRINERANSGFNRAPSGISAEEPLSIACAVRDVKLEDAARPHSAPDAWVVDQAAKRAASHSATPGTQFEPSGRSGAVAFLLLRLSAKVGVGQAEALATISKVTVAFDPSGRRPDTVVPGGTL
jgi:hypothetical protein